MRSPCLLAALCAATVASAADTALAQRGQDSLPEATDADADDHRLDFGNSLFRGGALARGEFEVAGPLLAVRYGLSRSTTIGAQVWAFARAPPSCSGIGVRSTEQSALQRMNSMLPWI